ncbi:MAG: DUF1737 domain-containing protein [Candidatus Cloacimonetes bacterium]|nr:DUF1737 domain-containing protein [Candidatus Cloacimonadota bacterium]
MKKIISYRIAYGESVKELEDRVNKFIEQGYEPFGEIRLAPTPESMLGEFAVRLYLQTMVMYGKEDE